MEAPKPEEISHPPMDQLQGLEYCIDSNPSWGNATFSECTELKKLMMFFSSEIL